MVTLPVAALADLLLRAHELGSEDSFMGRRRDRNELLALALLNWQETTTSEGQGHDV